MEKNQTLKRVLKQAEKKNTNTGEIKTIERI